MQLSEHLAASASAAPEDEDRRILLLWAAVYESAAADDRARVHALVAEVQGTYGSHANDCLVSTLEASGWTMEMTPMGPRSGGRRSWALQWRPPA